MCSSDLIEPVPPAVEVWKNQPQFSARLAQTVNSGAFDQSKRAFLSETTVFCFSLVKRTIPSLGNCCFSLQSSVLPTGPPGNSQEINFCGLTQPAFGILLWQPEEINANGTMPTRSSGLPSGPYSRYVDHRIPCTMAPSSLPGQQGPLLEANL